MSYFQVFIGGALLGALSWAICPVVSGQFEPYDTGIGLAIGQFTMFVFVAYVGWTRTFGSVVVAVVGIYLGQNTYAFIFGSSETRAWAMLGLIASMFLCIVPLSGGLVARAIALGFKRRGQGI